MLGLGIAYLPKSFKILSNLGDLGFKLKEYGSSLWRFLGIISFSLAVSLC